ncbi:MAG: hypothetical protein GX267_14900 [Fibrobacter sp.]|jgi:hypothetical protein|nr:hypothetical protein [Fibrobacter sp.]
MRFFLCFISLFLVGMFLSCENPFLPPTGKPDKTFSLRSTPEGVLKQLIEAYESKRIDLYEELLSDSFQFYVAPTFISSYQAKYDYDFEGADTMLSFTTGSRFYYWTKAEEVESHRKLFSSDDGKNKEIRFRYAPELTNTRSYGDSAYIEMMITGGELLIQLSTTGAVIQTVEYTIAIEKQVFLLEKDRKDKSLWVIRKWYDLSNAPNDL